MGAGLPPGDMLGHACAGPASPWSGPKAFGAVVAFPVASGRWQSHQEPQSPRSQDEAVYPAFALVEEKRLTQFFLIQVCGSVWKWDFFGGFFFCFFFFLPSRQLILTCLWAYASALCSNKIMWLFQEGKMLKNGLLRPAKHMNY